MACDLCFTQSDTIQWKGKTKIYKFKANDQGYPHCDYMIGFAGTAADMMTASEFFNNPEDFKRVPVLRGLTGLVLTQKRDIYVFSQLDKWLLMDEPFAAIGSGSTFAFGAMATGATPKEAVKIASLRDPWTGLGIKSLKWES